MEETSSARVNSAIERCSLRCIESVKTGRPNPLKSDAPTRISNRPPIFRANRFREWRVDGGPLLRTPSKRRRRFGCWIRRRSLARGMKSVSFFRTQNGCRRVCAFRCRRLRRSIMPTRRGRWSPWRVPLSGWNPPGLMRKRCMSLWPRRRASGPALTDAPSPWSRRRWRRIRCGSCREGTGRMNPARSCSPRR